MSTTPEVLAQAEREVADEAFRSAVEAAKETIRARKGRPWWTRLVPFRITIERIN